MINIDCEENGLSALFSTINKMYSKSIFCTNSLLSSTALRYIKFLGFLSALLMKGSFAYSQHELAARIAEVENGIALQAITLDSSTRTQGHIIEKMKQHNVPGVSVAVIRNGNIDWCKGYGIADKTTGDSVTSQTLFQSASIGKVITALAALYLVKEGRLSLD